MLSIPNCRPKRKSKTFGEQTISAMINEFRQLDQGSFPGKPVVVSPAYLNQIAKEDVTKAHEAVKLIYIEIRDDGIIKARTCSNGRF